MSLALLVSSPLVRSAPAQVTATQAEARKSDPSDRRQAGKTEPGTGGARAKQAHTRHPEAQWYPDAGFGLFIHWGISSVRAMNISWPMVPGRALGGMRILNGSERERIVREGDYELTGQPPVITPNEYWQMARDFNPRGYDPDKWLKAAKEAGFTYAVLTAKHHEGFALWPSAHGDFNTKNHMGGRDLVKPFVDACRRHGLKVGLYFSPTDWYFDREYMSFLYFKARDRNPEFPPLGPDLRPRTMEKSPEEIEKHHAAYASLIKGQVEELLTRYGKIDLLWFDGPPRIPNVDQVITVERIRELQPGIVINPRLHGKGDFSTFERRLPTARPDVDWAEFCNTWTTSWSHQEIPFRANASVLGQLALFRSWGFNYLLGVGPMANGEFAEGVYRNMAVVGDWMRANGKSVQGTRPLPETESSSVPATSHGATRYLFAIPSFEKDGAYPETQLPPEDETITLVGAAKPASVTLLSTGKPLEFTHAAGVTEIKLPAGVRTTLVDVVRAELSTNPDPKAGDLVPPFEAEAIDGVRRHIDYPKGSTTVLLFFLSGCRTFHRMLPLWNDAYEQRAKGVNVIGVLIDREPPGFFDTTEIRFPVVRSPGHTLLQSYSVQRAPLTMRVGEGGRVLDAGSGKLDPMRLGEIFRR